VLFPPLIESFEGFWAKVLLSPRASSIPAVKGAGLPSFRRKDNFPPCSTHFAATVIKAFLVDRGFL